MTNPDLKNRILAQIQAQRVGMRPKVYFTLRLLALFVVALATLVISVFILNFILFSVRINNHDALLGFGPRGLSAFLHIFPWSLLVADIALIAALESLVRHFKFGYRVPVLYLLLGLLVLTGLTGFVLDRGTRFNDDVLSRADRHELFEPFGELYEHARYAPPPGSGICKCTIVSIAGNTLVLRDTHSTSTLTVTLPPNDPHATTTGLSVGDTVLVAGDADTDDGTIHAFGVRIVPADFAPNSRPAFLPR